jgi:hypothetical protein
MNKLSKRFSGRPPRGVAPVLGLILILFFIPFVVLSVDLTNVFRVKTELQVAAESAALSGARSLFFNGHGPDWNTAEAQATEIGRLYYAQGALIRDIEVVTGYWHPSNPSEIKSPFGGGITFDDYPAVSVTLRKAPGKNEGPFVPAFGGVIGLEPVPLSVTAVSIVSGVGEVAPQTLFPFVMSRCLFTYFWNATGDPPGPAIDPSTESAYIFQLGDGFNTPPCGALQGFWTSYSTVDNSASGIRTLLETKNSQPLRLGDDIWLPTGLMNTVYNRVSQLLKLCPDSSGVVCDDVIVAVINDPEPGQWSPIEAFACIRILSADGGSRPNVRVQMTTDCDTKGTGGVGPPLIVGHPKLVR